MNYISEELIRNWNLYCNVYGNIFVRSFINERYKSSCTECIENESVS